MGRSSSPRLRKNWKNKNGFVASPPNFSDAFSATISTRGLFGDDVIVVA